MSAYIAQLNRIIAEAQAARLASEEAKHAREVGSAREFLSPLEDRLGRLLAAIPHEVQKEGLALSALQTALRGRRRGSCHPGELGTALRKLGWRRERRWRGSAASFSASWFPPSREQT